MLSISNAEKAPWKSEHPAHCKMMLKRYPMCHRLLFLCDKLGAKMCWLETHNIDVTNIKSRRLFTLDGISANNNTKYHTRKDKSNSNYYNQMITIKRWHFKVATWSEMQTKIMFRNVLVGSEFEGSLYCNNHQGFLWLIDSRLVDLLPAGCGDMSEE